MADEKSWEVLIRMPQGSYIRTPKIFNRQEALSTAFGMLDHSDVVAIQGNEASGWEIIDLPTIRRDARAD